MTKIVFISRFSNSYVRGQLDLRSNVLLNHLRRLVGKEPVGYDDSAIWTSDYITEFEKHKEIEFHILGQHKGMKKSFQHFVHNGIYYHFYRSDGSIVSNFVRSKLLLNQRNNYQRNRDKASKIISQIRPDLIILCGAENPHYGSVVLDINDIPICVILQTLLNDPKRIEMNVGNSYRRDMELKIFKHAQYFFTTSEQARKLIVEHNKSAEVFPVGFPTHQPSIMIPEKKDCDFVFFARKVLKNKGIEDILKALAIVQKSHHNVVLHVIGDCEVDYKTYLNRLISELSINNNVRFLGYFQKIEDTYSRVAKARVVVVPGITASLNSTVRESMLMGLPTICYEAADILDINKDKTCLMMAKSCDINDLAYKMQYALDNPKETAIIAKNGKLYAERDFGNETIVNKLLDNCRQIIDKRV